MSLNPALVASMMGGQLQQSPEGTGLMDMVTKLMGGEPGQNPGSKLFMLAGMGMSEIMRNMPKVMNSLMDLQSAGQGQEDPGSLQSTAEPPPPGPPGGMPPPGMPPPGMPPPGMPPPGMPPPGMGPMGPAAPPPGGVPPGVAMALMQMIRQRQGMA